MNSCDKDKALIFNIFSSNLLVSVPKHFVDPFSRCTDLIDLLQNQVI